MESNQGYFGYTGREISIFKDNFVSFFLDIPKKEKGAALHKDLAILLAGKRLQLVRSENIPYSYGLTYGTRTRNRRSVPCPHIEWGWIKM